MITGCSGYQVHASLYWIAILIHHASHDHGATHHLHFQIEKAAGLPSQ